MTEDNFERKVNHDLYVLYLNNKKPSENWKSHKQFKDCTEEELSRINLREWFPDEIILDVEADTTEELIEKKDKIIRSLTNRGYHFTIVESNREEGVHIHLFFEGLSDFSDDVVKEIRREFVRRYRCDEKAIGVKISMAGRPHFKSGKICKIIYSDNAPNKLDDEIIKTAKEAVKNKKESDKLLGTITKDVDFKDYFEKDPFFIYLKNLKTQLPKEAGKNNIILKNIAIAAAKTGKEQNEIQQLMTNVMKTVMPDKTYQEFNGWYKKALIGNLKEYNYYEINNWYKTYSGDDNNIYDLKSIIVDLDIDKSIKQLFLDLTFPNKAIILSDKDKYLKAILEIKDTLLREFFIGHMAYSLMIQRKTIIDELKKIEKNKTATKPVSAFNLINTEVEDEKYIIDKILPKGRTLLIGGKGGKGKSLFVLNLCLATKTEGEYLNKFNVEEDPKILYYDLENGPHRNAVRLQYISKGMSLKNKSSPFDFMFDFNISNPSDELEKCKDYDMIVLDSFRRFLDGSENDSETTNKFYNNFLKPLADMRKTIVIIHHLKKCKMSEMESEDLLDSFRGSSDIVNQFDSVYILTKGDDTMSVDGKKMNFDMFINLQVKNRDGNIANNLAVNVIKDDSDKKTTFSYSSRQKPMNAKETALQSIITYVNSRKETTTSQIYSFMKERNIFNTSAKRYIAELVENEDIRQTSHGVYGPFVNDSGTENKEVVDSFQSKL